MQVLLTEDEYAALKKAAVSKPVCDEEAFFSVDTPVSMAQLTREYAKRVLLHANGNLHEAAKILGVHRATAYSYVSNEFSSLKRS